jgi:hypothetical protein
MKFRVTVVALVFFTVLSGYCLSFDKRDPESISNTYMQDTPTTDFKYHNVGKIWLTITNFSLIGNFGRWKIDGENYPSCEYPGGSKADYLYMGALWIGTVEQTSDTTADTLVSAGTDGWSAWTEFWATAADSDTIRVRSNLFTSPYLNDDAVSEQDLMAKYSDAFVENASPSSHNPIGIQVRQCDYSWSYAYYEDFVFIQYKIINTKYSRLQNLYAGLFIDGDVGPWGPDYQWWKSNDDICGFRQWRDNSDNRWQADYYDKNGNSIAWHYKTNDPSQYINLAWIADFDGDKEPDPYLPDHPLYHWPISADGATGLRLIDPLPDKISFNWWFSNRNDARDWGPALPQGNDVAGTPDNDAKKYILLSNGRIDPDMVGERGVNQNPNYAYPQDVDSVNDARYLLSFGPYTIEPRDTLSLVFVYIAGEDFVTQYAQYDFSDIALNASWAYRIYDNPGFDTPIEGGTVGDGYKGDFVLYDPNGGPIDDADTVWVTGDGVPDFLGPPPPPIPNTQIIPGDLQITLLWGDNSEHYQNIFLTTLGGIPEGLDTSFFEGYRIYRSETGAPGEWTFIREYDLVDYADSAHTEPIGWNNGMPQDTIINGIRWYKFVDQKMPNFVPKCYSVVAFDKGWPFNDGSILPMQESSIPANRKLAYPCPPSDLSKPVTVVPNPYRAAQTDRYLSLRWEDWEGEGWDPTKRRISFTNLPNRCTIRVYSLGGDLVKTIQHDYSQSNRTYENWNLITEDILLIVPGIYLFSVEGKPSGSLQVGKFVVIK